MTDAFQSLVAARAKALGLSAYRIAQLCDWTPSEDAVARYLRGDGGLNSGNLSAVLRALGWDGRIGWSKKNPRSQVPTP